MKRSVKPRRLLVFLIAATVLMVIVDLILLQGFIPQQQEGDTHGLPVVDSNIFQHSEIADFESALPAPVNTPDKMTGWKDLSVPPPATEKYTVVKPPIIEERAVEKITEPESVPLRKEGEPAKIVIIIDDMGMDRKRSNRAVELPGPLTLAFLPYAPKLDSMTGPALQKGHELIIHMPMEAMDKHMNPGPIALKADMSDAEMDAMLEKAFASFEGYVGINNHMGSRMTKDKAAMQHVMAALKTRGLFFVDSKTIGSSVGSNMAAQAGIPYADRDVFLDHQDTPEFVQSALRQLERVAMKKGYAIAIGHPKDSTLNALKEWLPTLKGRGFELVPVSDVVRRSKPAPEKIEASVRSSSPFYFGPAQPPAPLPVSQPLPY